MEELRSVVCPELGPQTALLRAPYVSRGRFVCLNPFSGIDTVILDIGVARVWPLIATNPVDGASKGCTAMLIVAVEEETKTSIPLSSPKLATVVDLTKVGALIRVGREDVDDVVLHHSARAQADVFARALLT